MSQKALIVAVAVAMLLATVAVPAIGAVPTVGDAVPVQAEAWSQIADSPDTWLARVRPKGGCQSGGGGGCTI